MTGASNFLSAAVANAAVSDNANAIAHVAKRLNIFITLSFKNYASHRRNGNNAPRSPP